MDSLSSGDFADQIADLMTDRSGRIWDQESRQRLASWLDDPGHRLDAERWSRYVDSSESGDPMSEFTLRKHMNDVLVGGPSVVFNGFISRTNRWWPLRRRLKAPR